MELAVVMGIIAVIVTMTLPQLLPALTFTTHEGAARRLAGYGRSAIGHATLMRERVTVKIDLNLQEYWTERLPEAPEKEGLGEEGRFFDEMDDLPTDSIELFALAMEASGGGDEMLDDERNQKIVDRQRDKMNRRFERMARQALLTQAKRVVHDRQGILDEVSPLFESEFSLDPDADEELEPEELLGPLLRRGRVPNGVEIDSIRIGEEVFTSGLVEIEITPLGLEKAVVLFIVNDEGHFFTVEWDPVTGGTHMRSGRESVF